MKVSRCLMAILPLLVTACKLDNYPAPDSSFYGSIQDSSTGEQIQCDIVNGTVLHYYEQGYTGLQTGLVRNDGSFNIGLMFAGDYKIVPVQTNFEPVDTLQIKVSGPTEYTYKVEPYIRISNVTIISSGSTKVSATFTVETVNKARGVMKAGLFVHPEPNVGAYLCVESRELTIGGMKMDNPTTYTVVFDYSESQYIKTGRKYWFRVGALSDAPSARYNYAPAIELDL